MCSDGGVDGDSPRIFTRRTSHDLSGNHYYLVREMKLIVTLGKKKCPTVIMSQFVRLLSSRCFFLGGAEHAK